VGISGIVLTFAVALKAMSYGIASLSSLFSLLPYCAAYLLAKKARSAALTTYILVCISAFTIIGNYLYFDKIVLHFSPSNAMFFFVVPLVECALLIPCMFYVIWARRFKNSSAS
jgi:hypothetical protein